MNVSGLGGTLILLVVAIALLYLAVTDRLSRIIDAFDVATGKSSVTPVSGQGGTTVGTGTIAINFPSLPPLSSNVQVQA